ncbi:MAG: hypothetical protein FWE45_00680 [Firmicutes bacterium]|nr:hypothetical protein [Bacillota bacterium]
MPKKTKRNRFLIPALVLSISGFILPILFLMIKLVIYQITGLYSPNFPYVIPAVYVPGVFFIVAILFSIKSYSLGGKKKVGYGITTFALSIAFLGLFMTATLLTLDSYFTIFNPYQPPRFT